MSNRQFTQFSYQLEKKVCNLFAEFTVGASNAITIVRAKGIKSIARSAAGQYTVTLDNGSGGADKYAAILDINIGYKGTIADTAPLTFTLLTDSVSTAGTFIIQVVNSSKTATDLAQNDDILMSINLADTNIK